MHQALAIGRAVGGGAVETIAGTAGQIVVTPATGDVVISLDNPLLPPGRVRVIDGTAASPSYSFANETTTGFFRNGTNIIGATIGSNLAGQFGIFTGGLYIKGPASTDGFINFTSTGAITLTAGTTAANQSITLTPSGTGPVQLAGGTNINWGVSGNAGIMGNNAGGSSSFLRFVVGGGEAARFAVSGNLLLGSLSTDGTGILQFPAATTSAGGITMGVDIALWRAAAGSLVFDHPGGSNPNFIFGENATEKGRISTASGVMTIRTSTANSLILQTNSTTALTLGSTQIATFAGQIRGINGAANGPGYTFTNDSASGMYLIGVNSLGFSTNSTLALTLDSSQNATFAKKITSYNGVATTGWGVPSIVATGRFTAQSAAGNITNGAYTVGAADGTFQVSGNINIISAIGVSTSLNVAYTDETNTARTMILPLSGLAGSFVAAGLATTTGPFESAVMHIRCKASTTITFSVAAGTFTSVSYNAECTIKQTA